METNNIVTVLTPTYNRSKYLSPLYNSLLSQTSRNFKWIIVDDGSIDNTEYTVNKFIKDNLIDITYIKKENGGKHTALNMGIKSITSPLTFIVDSDDILTNDAIETIESDYSKILSKSYCGLAYLRGYTSEKIIGTFFVNEGYSNMNIIRYKDGVKGDKAEVWKTDCLKEIPFPVFKNEKFIGEHYVWCQLSEKYDMYVKNKIIYITEYLAGGLTKSGRKMRIACPYGGMASSKILLTNKYPLKTRIKNSLLYTCYGFFAKEKLTTIVSNSDNPILIFFMLPFGFLMYMYWRLRYCK